MMMNAYIILVILCICSTYYVVEGLLKNILYEEDIHINSRIIDDATKESLFFECIDLQNQPAFDHPVLKNHKIQMEPSLEMKITGGRGSRYDKREALGLFKYTACPNNSVPIQRRKTGLIHPSTMDNPQQEGHHYATLVATSDYRGASAIIQVNQPPVEPYQYSGGVIWIGNYQRDTTETICAGWMVIPELYGDNKARFTGSWMGNGDKNGCYNTLCPGFVQINPYFPLGSTFAHISTPEQQFGFELSIFQDQVSGNWWLAYGVEMIGYWPKEIFTTLNKGATNISFGGITHTQIGRPSPPMGAGTFATHDSKTSSIFRSIQTVDANYHVDDIDYSKTQTFVDKENCYSILRWDYDPTNGAIISYGGPGGDCDP